MKAADHAHSATENGRGPFPALHVCLRQCLSKVYPQITVVRLTDYKVRVLDNQGTAAKVRRLIE